jgi:hypothetical protein
MTEHPTNDLKASRREAAELLGVDLAHMCPADRLRVDLVCTLRRVIDAAGETVLEGGAVDISRLVNTVEQLIKLLPARQLAAPESQRADPRQVMWEIYKTMRERGELGLKALAPPPDEGLMQAKINEQAAEIERLKAQLAGGLAPALPDVPTLVESVPAAPAAANVVPLPRPNPPAASAAPQYDYNKDRGWRDYVEADATIRSTPRGRGHYWGPV